METILVALGGGLLEAFQPINLAMIMLGCVIGLFVGAIILALGYELFMAWLDQEVDDAQEILAEDQQV